MVPGDSGASMCPDEGLVAYDALGATLTNLGRMPEARAQHERALAIHLALLGPDNPLLASQYNNLGTIDLVTGRTAAARRCFERSLEIQTRSLAPDHPDIAASVNNIGLALLDGGDPEAGLEKFRRPSAASRRAAPARRPTSGGPSATRATRCAPWAGSRRAAPPTCGP